MLCEHLGLQRKKRCLSLATLLGFRGLNLEVEWEQITFLGNELLSSEVCGILLFFFFFSTEKFPVVLWGGGLEFLLACGTAFGEQLSSWLQVRRLERV